MEPGCSLGEKHAWFSAGARHGEKTRAGVSELVVRLPFLGDASPLLAVLCRELLARMQQLLQSAYFQMVQRKPMIGTAGIVSTVFADSNEDSKTHIIHLDRDTGLI
jgi:hypothetical protein